VYMDQKLDLARVWPGDQSRMTTWKMVKCQRGKVRALSGEDMVEVVEVIEDRGESEVEDEAGDKAEEAEMEIANRTRTDLAHQSDYRRIQCRTRSHLSIILNSKISAKITLSNINNILNNTTNNRAIPLLSTPTIQTNHTSHQHPRMDKRLYHSAPDSLNFMLLSRHPIPKHHLHRVVQPSIPASVSRAGLSIPGTPSRINNISNSTTNNSNTLPIHTASDLVRMYTP
jgi:hypothetical protein